MPRKARKYIIAPGVSYHIVCRGNNEKRIFRSVRDRKRLLKIIEETKRKYPFYLYSYSLMSNHYHLEIETIEESISKIMHRINFLYAIYFRKKYKISGHLFQDRYFSNIIEKESYFCEVARYIELNAVRAGLVEKPEDYRWASFQFYFQEEYNGDLIDRERFLKHYSRGDDLDDARLDYIQFVHEGMKIERLPSFITKKTF